MKRVLSVLLALCLLVGVVPVFATAAPSTEQYMRQVLDLVNKERAKVGAAPLGSNAKLNKLADIRAKELVSNLSHTRPDGRSCFTVFEDNGITSFSKYGENVAAGQMTPAVVMNSWMNSPSHRDNILDTEFDLVGIGCCQIPVANHAICGSASGKMCLTTPYKALQALI